MKTKLIPAKDIRVGDAIIGMSASKEVISMVLEMQPVEGQSIEVLLARTGTMSPAQSADRTIRITYGINESIQVEDRSAAQTLTASGKKRADQLVTGDVWLPSPMPLPPGYPGPASVPERFVMVAQERPPVGADVCVWLCSSTMAPALSRRTFNPDQMLEVEAPAVTTLRPSQMHAEEMLAVLKAALTAEGPAIVDAIRDVIDKIEPPPAPTIDELAAVLFNLEPLLATIEPGDRRRAPALAIIDRLRRSGAVK